MRRGRRLTGWTDACLQWCLERRLQAVRLETSGGLFGGHKGSRGEAPVATAGPAAAAPPPAAGGRWAASHTPQTSRSLLQAAFAGAGSRPAGLCGARPLAPFARGPCSTPTNSLQRSPCIAPPPGAPPAEAARKRPSRESETNSQRSAQKGLKLRVKAGNRSRHACSLPPLVPPPHVPATRGSGGSSAEHLYKWACPDQDRDPSQPSVCMRRLKLTHCCGVPDLDCCHTQDMAACSCLARLPDRSRLCGD